MAWTALSIDAKPVMTMKEEGRSFSLSFLISSIPSMSGSFKSMMITSYSDSIAFDMADLPSKAYSTV